MTSPNPHAIDTDTLSGMKPLRKVVYSVGSNLGDRLGNLQGAVDALSDTPDIIIVDISSVYETEPIGGPEDNPQVPQSRRGGRDDPAAADPARASIRDRGRLRPDAGR